LHVPAREALLLATNPDALEEDHRHGAPASRLVRGDVERQLVEEQPITR
jgi:hypothetical protein